MPRKGLSNEAILQNAMDLIIEKGFSNLSLNDIAKRSGMKPPSMYNHFSGIDEIRGLLAVRIEYEMNRFLLERIHEMHRDEAIRTLAWAQLQYAREFPELYEVILALPQLSDPSAEKAAEHTVAPIMSVLNEYELKDADLIHLHRMFRSFVQGFIALSRAGYLTHRHYTTDESFEASVEYFIQILHGREHEAHDNMEE